MATPHNQAKLGDFAKTVLMPGDPKRSEFIAKNFLDNPKLVNDVRGIKGYTGTYKGVPVSVMASGMGMPSMAIYSYELLKFYGVDNIIRVGSTGAYQKELELYDIVLAQGACTDSNYLNNFNLKGTFSPICDFTLLSKAVKECEKAGVRYHVGNVLSSDCFYTQGDVLESWANMGVLSVEMESAALYANALSLNKKALTILTVSDSLVTGKETTSEERQTAFTDMMKIALEVAVSMSENND